MGNATVTAQLYNSRLIRGVDKYEKWRHQIRTAAIFQQSPNLGLLTLAVIYPHSTILCTPIRLMTSNAPSGIEKLKSFSNDFSKPAVLIMENTELEVAGWS
jgi:hypothetical protein